MLILSSSESINLSIPNQSVPLRHYLQQPHRLVGSLASSNQVVSLGNKRFRLYLNTIVFFAFRVQPIVDLEIINADDDRLYVRSIACEIRGNDFVNQHFNLSLSGHLKYATQTRATRLMGQADLKISVGIPPVLDLVPKTLLEKTGNHILRSILMTMKQRIIHNLATDYRRWSEAQKAEDIRMNAGKIWPSKPLNNISPSLVDAKPKINR